MRSERAAAAALLIGLLVPDWAMAGETEALPRHSAPITVLAPAPFIQLPLPVTAYAHSRQPGLADLRVFDATGQRVPFAVLAPRADELKPVLETTSATLYPLPPGPVGPGLPATLTVTVQGDRLQLRHRAGAPQTAGRAAAPGWIVDLGERPRDAPPPVQLRLQWPAEAEFSSGYLLEASDDLRQWRAAGGGQLMALRGSSGLLSQPLVPLEARSPRFLRLRWTDQAAAPPLTGAELHSERQAAVPRDPPTELRLQARRDEGPDAQPGAWVLDLGAVLPLQSLRVEWTRGTTVLPLRLQQRARADEPWQPAAQGVLYRIEREGAAPSLSPPLALQGQAARWLRLLPDERAPAQDLAATPVMLQVRLATLVIAQQGTPPYRLAVGLAVGPQPRRADGRPLAVTPGALPVETLVPALDQERPRFGRAELGAFSEQPEVARAAAQAEARAAWRPRLLWAGLLAGVGLLGWMVWRLARGQPAAPPPPA